MWWCMYFYGCIIEIIAWLASFRLIMESHKFKLSIFIEGCTLFHDILNFIE